MEVDVTSKRVPTRGSKAVGLRIPMWLWREVEAFLRKENLTITEGLQLLIEEALEARRKQ